MKFRPREGVFRIRAAQKMGREQKSGRKGVSPVQQASEESRRGEFLISSRVSRSPKRTYFHVLGFVELLFLLRFGTSPFEEKAICRVTSGQRWMEWSAFPFF